MEAGLIGSKPGASLLHATESTHRDVPIWIAAPRTSPSFQLQKFLWGFFDEGFHGVLIAQPIAARNRVIGMLIEAVIGLDHARGATLGGNRVAAHGINFGNDGNAELGIDFSCGDSGPQSCTPAAYKKDIVCRGVHGLPTSGLTRRAAASTKARVGTFSSYNAQEANGIWYLR